MTNVVYEGFHGHSKSEDCDPLTCKKSISRVANAVVNSMIEPGRIANEAEVVSLSDENSELLLWAC